MENKQLLTSLELREFCIKWNLFTNGDIRQYTQLFEFNNSKVYMNGYVNDIALLIWICSIDVSLIEVVVKLKDFINEKRHF